MIHIKKWITISVLTIILVLTTDTTVNAQSYVADDNYSISSQYHDIFNNYFDGTKSYLYFPYKCYYSTSYSRECFFGIDSEGNYLNINYIVDGSSYSLNYETGIDEDFSVTGNNIFRKSVDHDYILNYIIIFFILILVIGVIL